MDFALSPEQLDLASAVRDLIATHADLAAVRRVFDDPDGPGEPAGLWQRMVDQGWPALTVPTELDGLGLGVLEAAVVARALGAAVTPAPFVPTTVAALLLSRAAHAAQDSAWVAGLIDGSQRVTVALECPGAPYQLDDDDVQCTAGRLLGHLSQVEYAHLSSQVLVPAAGQVWSVDLQGAGVQVRRTPLLDGTTRTAEITLQDAVGTVLPGIDAHDIRFVRQVATVLYANDLVGLSRAALERTADYTRTRTQFGRAVGSFQALQHTMADLLVSLTMAEHTAWYAAHLLDLYRDPAAAQAPTPSAVAHAVSTAKAKAGDAAAAITQSMIQLHGGIGYTWEHDAHLYFKRALRERALLGDPDQHRDLVADLLLGQL